MKCVHLIMFPGWGMEKGVFQPLSEHLSKRFQLSFVDWRNISECSEITARARTIVQSIDEPVFLLGWSLGAIAALDAASIYPKNVKGLILIGATSRFTSDKNYLSGWHPRIVERMKKQLENAKEKTLVAFYESMFSISEKEAGFYDQFIKHVKNQCQGDHTLSLQIGLDYLIEKDVRKLLQQMNVPSLLIHGKEDTICPVKASIFMKEELNEQVSLSILEKTGHIPFFTKTDQCRELITTFIQEGVR
ncbi:alpha/beta fold hydrolase [Bacillus taeanensis]|uniref:Alpha/beta hydrolase n=1 Tax=Bacillus taeanensis TaxID=273032 RepID=A0A366XRZ4_9BACI|nr:alpha/beta hydrolase [Bacillus taeanensis]RBW68318.1 alpha/beta hydrolase [Bacillus taeanensis]